MRFLAQRFQYHLDTFVEIGTTDQQVTLNGHYHSIETAVTYMFREWAKGKIIRILTWNSDNIYGPHDHTYYLNEDGKLLHKQPRPRYESPGDWHVELFHAEFVGWGYQKDQEPMFYQPTMTLFKPDEHLDLVFDFPFKLPNLSDRDLHTKEFWRKELWGWRFVPQNHSATNWWVETSPDACLAAALTWARSQDRNGWVIHGHREPIAHALLDIRVRKQDMIHGMFWETYKSPAILKEANLEYLR